jgi:disulfide bond formation protein DsbB
MASPSPSSLGPVLRPILLHWPLAAACASAVVLVTVHASETFGGLLPCELCLHQREVYWAALAVGIVGFALGYMRLRWAGRLSDVLLMALFLLGAGIAAYHSGVEWKWWPGPTTCTGGGGAVNAGDLSAFLNGAKVTPPRCDEAAWRMLGVSMAGYNVLISLALAALSLLAARRDRTSDGADA